ncbi:hypothetical protein R1sor_022800 [Riccia sorocarpa]|uniref:Reverse transcriptase domain-containing protein n=1 Tax=Riccia sorocarpa TaxID=122646 RepID=A0ABD3GN32_9MARC
MSALRKEEERGAIRGLQLPGLKSILHELFADDTSFFIKAQARDFNAARSVIDQFEKASGSRLNMQKSLVMVLGSTGAGNWIRETGCEVAGSGRGSSFSVFEGGKPKTSLIAWWKLHRPKECDVLGWMDMPTRMTSQLAAKAIRSLKHDTSKSNWQRLARAILTKHLSKGIRKDWTFQEILLLAKGIRINKAPSLTRILSNWFNMRKLLLTDGRNLEFPQGLQYGKVECILAEADNIAPQQLKIVRKWARRLGWKTIDDMQKDDGTWRSLNEELFGSISVS